MKRLFIITIALTLLASCRDEIEMKYIPVEKLYVIDGYVSDQGVAVTVSTTRDMEDGNRETGVGDAVVEISGTDGYSETLQHQEKGHYFSPMGYTGWPGNTYTLTVKTEDGKEFVSTSEMNAPGKFSLPMEFSYEPTITRRYMLCSAVILDPADTENRYCLRVLNGGQTYSRTLITDRGHDGDEVRNTLLMRFSWDTAEEETEEEETGDGEESPDRFRPGDELTMILETIDRPVYDYLYSLSLSGGSLSNPLTNIKGGALGYFRAFSSDTYTMIFDPEALFGPRPEP